MRATRPYREARLRVSRHGRTTGVRPAGFFLPSLRRAVPTTRENAMHKSKATWRSRSPRRQSPSSSDAQATRPRSVTVVLSEGTLVITLHEALSPAEMAPPRPPPAPLRSRSFTGNCLPTPPTGCGRKSRESPAWKWRGGCGNRAGQRCCGAGFHDRKHSPGVPACRERSSGNLEWEWPRRSVIGGEVPQLSAARTSQESCPVGALIGLLAGTAAGVFYPEQRDGRPAAMVLAENRPWHGA